MQIKSGGPSVIEVGDSKNVGIRCHDLLTLTKRELNNAEKVQRSKALEYFDKVIKVIIAGKDFIANVAAQEPHASLAWAGISVLLPLLLNPYSQRTSLAAGVENIADILHRHETYISLLVPSKAEPLRQKLVDLYASILTFQARAIVQLYRPGVQRYLYDVVQKNDWNALAMRITDLDVRCEKHITAMNMEERMTSSNKLSSQMDNLLNRYKDEMKQRLDKEYQRCQELFAYGYEQQKDMNPLRVPDTCNWLLQHPKFMN